MTIDSTRPEIKAHSSLFFAVVILHMWHFNTSSDVSIHADTSGREKTFTVFTANRITVLDTKGCDIIWYDGFFLDKLQSITENREFNILLL